MRQVTLTFSIPDWVPTKKQIVQFYRNIRYTIKPFRCEKTGVRLNYKFPHYEYQHAKRVMVSTYTHVWCRAEWIKYINEYFASPPAINAGAPFFSDDSFAVITQQCDSCGCVAPTVGSMEHIRIGMQWWNGFRVCQTCLVETVRLGREHSTVYNYRKLESLNVNEAGAEIKSQPQSNEPSKITLCQDQNQKYTW